jgi:hypothetical protein
MAIGDGSLSRNDKLGEILESQERDHASLENTPNITQKRNNNCTHIRKLRCSKDLPKRRK